MDTTAGSVFWDSLPCEIRLQILQCILPRHGLLEATTERGFPKPSSLATVSREWRCFFEKETFRRMALISPDLPTFAKCLVGKNSIRLNYIHNMWFQIKLAKYSRHVYDKAESLSEIKA